jgi:hypothetical protein
MSQLCEVKDCKEQVSEKKMCVKHNKIKSLCINSLCINSLCIKDPKDLFFDITQKLDQLCDDEKYDGVEIGLDDSPDDDPETRTYEDIYVVEIYVNKVFRCEMHYSGDIKILDINHNEKGQKHGFYGIWSKSGIPNVIRNYTDGVQDE